MTVIGALSSFRELGEMTPHKIGFGPPMLETLTGFSTTFQLTAR
jgi:hypothetical protein